MPGRNAGDDALGDGFVSEFSLAPLRDRPSERFGRLAGHSHDLTEGLGTDFGRSARTRSVGKPRDNAPLGQGYLLTVEPALAPMTNHIAAAMELAGNVLIVVTLMSKQDNACSPHDLLGRVMSAHQGFQLLLDGRFQHNRRGLWGRQRASSSEKMLLL